MKVFSVKPEIDKAVHSPQFYSNITATLNCTLCSTLVIKLGKAHVPHQLLFNALLYCINVLYKSNFGDAVTLLYDLLLALHIYT